GSLLESQNLFALVMTSMPLHHRSLFSQLCFFTSNSCFFLFRHHCHCCSSSLRQRPGRWRKRYRICIRCWALRNRPYSCSNLACSNCCTRCNTWSKVSVGSMKTAHSP